MSEHFQSSISVRRDGHFVGGFIFRQPNEVTVWDREQVMYPDGSVRCEYTRRTMKMEAN